MTGFSAALIALGMMVGGLVWWFRRVGRVQIPKDRTFFVLWALVAGSLAVFALVEGGGWQSIVPASLALACALFVLMTVAISRQKAEGAISVGDSMPSFQALDENGETFDGASLQGQAVLIKFFRGHW